MDAVEFSYPAGVTVSKLMGSEGCGGGGSKMDPSSRSFPDKKEAASRNKMVNGELFKRASQLYSPFNVQEASKGLNNGNASNSLLLLAELDAKQQRKSGKVPKSYSSSSKKSRGLLEVSMKEAAEADITGKIKEGELSPSKCNVAEKFQLLKQKTNSNGKRSEKRHAKAFKGKVDSFSVKSGLASFSSAAGGNNILGVYGSRPDSEDVTKRLDELLLDDLLDGSYKCPSLMKDKGKKSSNSSSNLLNSVGEVWSILQKRKAKPQAVETDFGYYRDNMPSCLLNSGPVTLKSETDKGDIDMADLSSSQKVQDSANKVESSANILDFPLYEPNDILERLTLPPPKDLEFLLLDATKPIVPSRNNSDLRVSKPAYRGCLPPFPWSNASGSHCKSYPDSVKLSSSRSTCHGRWVKMKKPITSLVTDSPFLSDLNSLKYDESLLPPEIRCLVPAVSDTELPKSVSIVEQVLPSAATPPVDSQLSPDSPRALAAAEILSGMATRSSKRNGNPKTTFEYQKRPSENSMRAQNLQLQVRAENNSLTPKSKAKSDGRINTLNELRPSKKPKPSLNEKRADIVSNATTARPPLQWTMPRSSRSSSSQSFRYPIAETKHYSTNFIKKPFMMPPASRTLDAAPGSSQPKPRKLMRYEWNREGHKRE